MFKIKINKGNKNMKNFTRIFLTLSSIFIVWLYYFTIKLGLWALLWKEDPNIVIFIVSIGVMGLIWGFMDELKTYKRLNK